MKKLRITVNGTSYDVEVEVLEDDDDVGASYGFPPATSVQQPQRSSGAPAGAPSLPKAQQAQPAASTTQRPGSNEVTSPIAGVVNEVKVKVGDTVQEHDLLFVLEAMKMNTNISSPSSGSIKEINIAVGDAVQQGQVLLTFE
jgi:biotin carboxyl carrier protein